MARKPKKSQARLDLEAEYKRLAKNPMHDETQKQIEEFLEF